VSRRATHRSWGCPACRGAGFTLIEINLAIMLLAIGMLVIFSLFPAGLSQGDLAYRDSQAGLFADYVLNGIRGNVEAIGSWSDWTAESFVDTALAELTGVTPTGLGSSNELEFPAGSDNWVRYMLAISPPGGSGRRDVTLYVWGLRYGPQNAEVFRRRARWFHTALYFSGGQP